MPKATAIWLVDNTSLTFDQIAEFCWLHVLEVKGIADGDVAHGIKGMDPISSGQLSRGDRRRRGRLIASTEAVRAESRGAGGQDQARPALYAGVTPPGPTERYPLAAPQPPRAQGFPSDAAGRHHQADHPSHPRALALELAEPATAGSGDARALLADRPRCRGEKGRRADRPRAERVRHRRAAQGRHVAPCRRAPPHLPRPSPNGRWRRLWRKRRAAARMLPTRRSRRPTSTRCSPSSRTLRTDVTSD